jgi:hypothetical protein
MARSMQDPIAALGGTVMWTRSPWGGVRVEIQWQAPRSGETPVAVRSVEVDTMQVLPQIGPPFLMTFLGYGLLVVLAGWSTYEDPLWALGWLCLALAIAPFVGGVPAWASRLGLTGGPTWSARVVLGIGLAMLSTPFILRMEILAVGAANRPVVDRHSRPGDVGLCPGWRAHRVDPARHLHAAHRRTFCREYAPQGS